MADVLVDAAGQVAVSLRELRDGRRSGSAAGGDPPARGRGRPDRALGGGVAVRGRDRPDDGDPLEGIFDTLESAVDACETVANVLEGITLKRAANGQP